MPNTYSHRILTEDVNRQAITDILAKYFQSFTIVPTIGVWEGKAENSLSIEIIGAAYADILRASKEIRETCNQEAVLVFSVTGKKTLITGKDTQ